MVHFRGAVRAPAGIPCQPTPSGARHTGTSQMHSPPRAILARLVALSLIATAVPLNLPTSFAPVDASAWAAKEDHAAIVQQFTTDGHAFAGPGVDHTWGRIVTGSGQQVIHLVTVQAGAPGITMEAGLSN